MRPELAGIGAIPAARASLASVAKRSAPAISPTSLAAVSGPQPRSATSCGATWATRSAISVSSALMVCGQLAHAAQLVARDAHAHRLLGARQAPGDLARPLLREQRAAGQRQLGPEVVQVPLQRAVERHPGADQALAVIDQQADVELDTGQRRRRQRLDPGRQRGARDRHRVDLIGLPALTARPSTAPPSAASRRAQRVHRDRARSAPARPKRAGSPPRPRPADHRARAPSPTTSRTHAGRPGRSCHQGPDRSRHRSQPACASACAVSAPSTIMTRVHILSVPMLDARRTGLAEGAATLLICAGT